MKNQATQNKAKKLKEVIIKLWIVSFGKEPNNLEFEETATLLKKYNKDNLTISFVHAANGKIPFADLQNNLDKDGLLILKEKIYKLWTFCFGREPNKTQYEETKNLLKKCSKKNIVTSFLFALKAKISFEDLIKNLDNKGLIISNEKNNLILNELQKDFKNIGSSKTGMTNIFFWFPNEDKKLGKVLRSKIVNKKNN